MIEDWIDALVDVANGVDGIWAPYIFKRREFPESLDLSKKTALTFVDDVGISYPDAGPDNDTWSGSTEFHLTANTLKSNYPDIMKYFGLIRNAFKGKKYLLDIPGHSVYMKLRKDGGPSIEMVKLTYGSETEHFGLLVHWVVWERYS